ncbi:HPr family phosphocarrier protein [Defluviitalea saccharophila]|jgi:phosphocarrier protein HPr|uniref:Phosphocarrier protein HPr n=1 Tax=Defluviitalea saccharophila TaxID=879970 RepID=A0ABZ2Y7V3_9FIRM|nr:HPr family phosphocarrier protein [Candidatus Epulonipiscium sp.]
MIEKTFIVAKEEGLHARPASELTKLCQKFSSDIKLAKDSKEVNPKSILGILSLGAGKGDKVTVKVNGQDEQEAMKTIEQFFKS